MERIYADNAATTRISDEVLAAMMPFLKESFANPSSYHSAGREVRVAIENARKKIASVIECDAAEIYFTSGGTESDNWAIRGAARLSDGKKHCAFRACTRGALWYNFPLTTKETK